MRFLVLYSHRPFEIPCQHLIPLSWTLLSEHRQLCFRSLCGCPRTFVRFRVCVPSSLVVGREWCVWGPWRHRNRGVMVVSWRIGFTVSGLSCIVVPKRRMIVVLCAFMGKINRHTHCTARSTHCAYRCCSPSTVLAR